ncbi:peptide/nickel transport system substrate-binding protein [Rhizobium sp. BK313]|jgi:peptide/nickel transport system substrate-binding protein|uniref:ABC transporter substrate-binding protein n=1 Tax=Rhizobium sp. BK313 TaxID=2587081 RepID=UPI00105DED29|nr:ABC transporter substrate-binding protein [Rhizobium sp. BK313]MBB3455540.1 peptide/nickel transport system substrate-binding protein [Rhizobium sp. BK313]
MVNITRRGALGMATAAAGSLILPRFSIAQADNRPSITIAVQKISNTNTMDPLREQSNVGQRIFNSSLWEGLIGLNWLNGLTARPELATEWRRIDDKTVELKLRQGVKFHNGQELTAEDVAFSFSKERMFADTQPSTGKTIYINDTNPIRNEGKSLPPEVPATARRFWPALEGVEIVDKYTVRFVNGSPDVTMEGRLSTVASAIASRRGWEDAKSYLDWARAPVTTGPYRVADFKPDTYLVYEAHDEYWGGRPPLKQIRFVEVPEVASRVNGLLSGEYQFACDIPPDQISGIEKNAAFEVQGGTITNHRLTVFDKNHPQLANPLVRRAFTHAIDRQAIVDSLWSGRTVVPAGLQWDFYGDMFVKGWTVPEYNPDLARQLLKEANYKGDVIPYRLLDNYYTNQTPTGQILVEMWNQVGLNVEIGMKENWQAILEKGPTRAVRDWSNSASFNDPVSSIVAQHGPNGQQQQVGEWTNAEMNTLSTFLETSTDRAKRHDAFARMLQICEREDPAYTVLHQNAVFTAKPKSLKWKAASAFAMDFRPGNWA